MEEKKRLKYNSFKNFLRLSSEENYVHSSNDLQH
jgi:hypothetical protein